MWVCACSAVDDIAREADTDADLLRMVTLLICKVRPPAQRPPQCCGNHVKLQSSYIVEHK